MIDTEQQEIIIKEKRRAKRNKKWLADGNVIPLSSKERKAIENFEYRLRIRNKNIGNANFNNDYKGEIYAFANGYDFSHKGTLTYRLNVSMFKAYRDANRIFELLKKRSIIKNYLFIVEFMDKHVHTHFIINGVVTNLMNTINNQFNGRFDNGYVYLKKLENEIDKDNQLVYLIDKLNPEIRNRQCQIDYWSFDLELKENFYDVALPQHNDALLIENNCSLTA